MPSRALDPGGGQASQVYLFNSEVTTLLSLAQAEGPVLSAIAHAPGLQAGSGEEMAG